MALVDKGNETALIQANVQEVKKALRETHGVALFQVRMADDQEERTVLVKKVDLEPGKKRITHMTLQEVDPTDVIRISVPVEAVGVPAAVSEKRGTLVKKAARLRVRCAVSDVPMRIDVPVAELGLGCSLTAKELDLPDGVEIVASPDAVVFAVNPVEPAPEAEEVPPPAPSES